MTHTFLQLAATQLADLERVSEGALEVLAEPEDDKNRFLLSLDTSGISQGTGIRVRAREQFEVLVPDTFPHQPPTVLVKHRRWQKTPHVQWGRLLCLYAAPSVEWNPADGMRGLVERLLVWLERAAEGTLDPDGQPLHPPVAYHTSIAGHVIIHPDLGHRVPWHPESHPQDRINSRLFAWCSRSDNRLEVLEWLSPLEAYERALSENTCGADEQGCAYFFCSVVLVCEEIGWEYPRQARHLAAGLAQSGYTSQNLLADLTHASKLNRALRSHAGADSDLDADPVVMLVGTPSRRVGGGRRLAHLVGWKLDKLGSDITGLLDDVTATSNDSFAERVHALARDWLRLAEVHWMRIHEMRPELTNRRDRGTPASWLRGKRVLLLGCGALGAPVAEHCVRAGVKAITVVDNGDVTPGILVRQPYSYTDIGQAKAHALAQRANTITREAVVEAIDSDAIPLLLNPEFDPTAFDLIIDAAADVGLRSALEGARWRRRALWPPVVTMIIGHEADRGLATVSRAGATGSGHDLLRRVALRARGPQARLWSDVADDFFPDPPRTAMFFPEPGCSQPTFVASAADVATLASHMLTQALRSLNDDRASQGMMTALAIRTAFDPRTPIASATSLLTWENDLICIDPDTGYEVRMSAEALAEMRAETRRGARVRGPQVETGGMLLGAFDDSTGVVNIDVATGPSPDSLLSEIYFRHGTAGTQEVIDHHLRRTGGITGFLGIWHTHPNGRSYPSPTDEAGMAALTTFGGTGRRALMVILGGASPTWQAWHDGTGVPDLYIRTVCRTGQVPATLETRSGTQPPAPPGTYFAGGYSYPADQRPPARHRWWWPFGAGR